MIQNSDKLKVDNYLSNKLFNELRLNRYDNFDEVITNVKNALPSWIEVMVDSHLVSGTKTTMDYERDITFKSVQGVSIVGITVYYLIDNNINMVITDIIAWGV